MAAKEIRNRYDLGRYDAVFGRDLVQYRNLGRAGVKVSPLCLGTMMFGQWGNRDHDECARIIHHAIDSGLNFIDTANMYSDGESEEIVGKALRQHRNDVVLATKVWYPMGKGPNQRGLSRKAIQEQVEKSLRRLQTDVIDLYQVHRPDPETPWEETLATLDLLVRQGKVRYVGCSTNHYDIQGQRRMPAWELVETLWISERRGWERFAALQPPYSLLRRTMEVEHFPATRNFGLANIVWSPLEGGWLAGKYRRGLDKPQTPRAQKWVPELEDPKFEQRLDVVEGLWSYLDRSDGDASMAQLALAWVLHNEDVTSAIIGPRTQEQLEDCLKCLEVDVNEDFLSLVDELVPPGTSAL